MESPPQSTTSKQPLGFFWDRGLAKLGRRYLETQTRRATVIASDMPPEQKQAIVHKLDIRINILESALQRASEMIDAFVDMEPLGGPH